MEHEIEYEKELKKIDTLLSNKQYKTIARDIGYLFEMALKELYRRQIDFFKANPDNKYLVKPYQRMLDVQEKLYPEFNVERATFAQLSNLFIKARFYELIELRINKPLAFSRNVPLTEIRKVRNYLLHRKNVSITRKSTLRYIDYLRIYLSETGLLNADVLVGEISCYSCHSLVDRRWKFCPNCGASLTSKCKSCGLELKSTWAVCPKCSTPREGVKMEKPEKVYGYYCQAVWTDGFLNREQSEFLKRKQKELGLLDEDARSVERSFAPENTIRFRDMIESCLTDGIIDEDEKRYLRSKADGLSINHELANSIYLACINDIIEDPLFDDVI
jgi:RNA polymerase subunit RPABC4/transcription elongation factor Spt4